MNKQTLANNPNRVASVHTAQAVKQLAMDALRRTAAYVFGRTDECRSLAPSYPSQLARGIGSSAMNTSLIVMGDGDGSIVYVDARFNIMGA